MASSQPQPGPRADHQLAVSQFADLNRQFFSEPGPAVYFDIRLRLLSAAADAADCGVPFQQRVALGTAVFAEGEVEIPTSFVAAEAMNIFHHAVETMWRLVLALEPPAACPRLGLARLRVGALKDHMKAYLEQDPIDRQQRLRNVLVPIDLATLDPTEEPELQRRLDGADRLLAAAARAWLQDQFIYNATKHGFAVGVKNQRVSLGSGEDDDGVGLTLSHAGTWLATITRDQSAKREKWVEVDVAVEPERIVWATGLCVTVMRTLWQVGQARFVDGRGVNIALPTVEEVETFTQMQHGRIGRVSKDLLYDDDTDRLIKLSVELTGQP